MKLRLDQSGSSSLFDNMFNCRTISELFTSDDDPETHPSDGIVTTRVLTDERTSELIPPHSQRLTTKGKFERLINGSDVH